MLRKLLNRFYENFIIWSISGLVISTITALFLLRESDLLDVRFKIRRPINAENNIVVITLDESFAKNLDYPDVVPRDYLAELIDTLSSYGARVIALDYEFRVSDRSDENYAKLKNSIKKAGNIVLPRLLNSKKNFEELLPVPPYELRIHSLTGYAELLGKHPLYMKLYTQLSDSLYEPSFALAAVAGYRSQKKFFVKDARPSNSNEDPFFTETTYSKADWDTVLQKLNYPTKGVNRFPINYFGPVYTSFTSHSSEDFLQLAKRGVFPKEIIANRLILIGSIYTRAPGKDEFSTPFGKLQGVEIHANIISNLLNQQYLINLGDEWAVFFAVLAFAVSAISLWKLHLTLATISTSVYLLGYTFAGFVLFKTNDWVLPLAWPVKAGIVGFFLTYLLLRHGPLKPKIREYLDFELLFQDIKMDNYYQLRVISAPTQAGDAKAEIKFQPKSELEKELKRLQRGHIDIDFLKDFGHRLYEKLFVPAIANCYYRSLTQARIEKKGLRLRLRIDVPDLRTLPWEYLYDQNNNFFLSANPEILLTRYVESQQPRRDMGVEELNVLIVISDPTSESLKKLNLAELDAEYEKELIVTALDQLRDKTDIPIRYTILEHAIPRKIQDRLDEGIHIFHLIGHSTFQHGVGEVVLENNKHHAILTNEKDFSDLFLGQTEMRLVILNSCKSAATSALPEISGLAYQIIDRGVPAVVAMQYPIADETAILFSREFYGTLANGHPLDFAMAHTRLAISQKLKHSWPADFGVPVLFMRARAGRII